MWLRRTITSALLVLGSVGAVWGTAWAFNSPTTLDPYATAAPNVFNCQAGYTCMWVSSYSPGSARTAWYKAGITSFSNIGFYTNNAVSMWNAVNATAPNENSYPAIQVTDLAGNSMCLSRGYLYTSTGIGFNVNSFYSRSSC